MKTPENGVYPIKFTHWKLVSNPDCSHIEKGEKPKKQTHQTGMESFKVDKSKRYIIQGNGENHEYTKYFITFLTNINEFADSEEVVDFRMEMWENYKRA